MLNQKRVEQVLAWQEEFWLGKGQKGKVTEQLKEFEEFLKEKNNETIGKESTDLLIIKLELLAIRWKQIMEGNMNEKNGKTESRHSTNEH